MIPNWYWFFMGVVSIGVVAGYLVGHFTYRPPGCSHQWSKWEWRTMIVTPVGLIYPSNVRGKEFEKETQVRVCSICGLEEIEK